MELLRNSPASARRPSCPSRPRKGRRACHRGINGCRLLDAVEIGLAGRNRALRQPGSPDPPPAENSDAATANARIVPTVAILPTLLISADERGKRARRPTSQSPPATCDSSCGSGPTAAEGVRARSGFDSGPNSSSSVRNAYTDPILSCLMAVDWHPFPLLPALHRLDVPAHVGRRSLSTSPGGPPEPCSRGGGTEPAGGPVMAKCWIVVVSWEKRL